MDTITVEVPSGRQEAFEVPRLVLHAPEQPTAVAAGSGGRPRRRFETDCPSPVIGRGQCGEGCF